MLRQRSGRPIKAHKANPQSLIPKYSDVATDLQAANLLGKCRGGNCIVFYISLCQPENSVEGNERYGKNECNDRMRITM